MNEENQTNDEKLLEYEELKMEAKKLAVRIDELKPEVLEIIGEEEKVNCKHGFIERKSRPKYTYSPDTTKLALDLKDTQKEEVAKGIATDNPTYFVEYRQDKGYVAE